MRSIVEPRGAAEYERLLRLMRWLARRWPRLFAKR
jgi:hypothetical protein